MNPEPVFEATEVQIPKCCTEGHEDCPHVINQKEIIKKGNIGL
jgi:hypothetical protein